MANNHIEQLKEAGLEMQPYWSPKYLKNLDKISRPVYKTKEEKNIYAPVRDGTKLCLDIFRPDAKDMKFPALIAWSSYGKAEQSHRRDPVPMGSLLLDHSIEIPDIDFFAHRGYAFVIPDPRGVGKSEGEYYGPFVPQEQQDLHDIIEWTAAQSWCDGNVGMIGVSYFGHMQYLGAGQQPPHLKAIFPWLCLYELYSNGPYQGGILSDFQHYFILNYNPNNPVSWSEKLYSEEELKHKIHEVLEDPVVSSNTFYVKILETWPPRYNTIFLDVLLHPLNSSFWESMSARPCLEKIEVPVYALGEGWYDPYMNPKLKTPKKAMDVGKFHGPPAHPCSYRYTQEEALRWYDHWLKGIDTGIMDEPPIKLWIGGVNRYRYENEWPLARTEFTKLYIQQYRQLATAEPVFQNKEPDAFCHNPFDLKTLEDAPSLVYATQPLNQPLEITGPIAVNLYISLDREDGNILIELLDEIPGGPQIPVTMASLKASHRTLDKNESLHYKPMHDHTKAIPVKPGEIYEYSLSMSCSHVFMPGHRLVLKVAAAAPKSPHHSSATTIGPMPFPWTTCYKIYHDEDHPSHLFLPVIPETPPDLWIDAPAFEQYLF